MLPCSDSISLIQGPRGVVGALLLGTDTAVTCTIEVALQSSCRQGKGPSHHLQTWEGHGDPEYPQQLPDGTPTFSPALGSLPLFLPLPHLGHICLLKEPDLQPVWAHTPTHTVSTSPAWPLPHFPPGKAWTQQQQYQWILP